MVESGESVWAWTFYSIEELTTALEHYADHDDQRPPSMGGDVVDPERRDRYTRHLARCAEIDRGMRLLAWEDRTLWRVLNQFYLQGMWVERLGWVAPARAAGLDVPICLRSMRCRVQGDDRMELRACARGEDCQAHYERFTQEVLPAAVRALWHTLGGRRE